MSPQIFQLKKKYICMGGVQVEETDPSKYNDDPKRRLPPGNEIPDFVIVIKKYVSIIYYICLN